MQKSQKKAQRKTFIKVKVIVCATFNNTFVVITTPEGNVLVQHSAGASGFKGSKKCTPFAATTAAEIAVKKAIETYGAKEADIFVKGPGSGRDAAVRAVASMLKITSVADVTPLPHNGCRQEKERRV
jgi:small subunit ribosomal protein S11